VKKSKNIPTRTELKIALAEKSFAHFFRYGWHVKEPDTPLEWNWHIECICIHIQAALEDWMDVKNWQKRQEKARNDKDAFNEPEPLQRIQDLLINVPPGTSKSRIVSVYTLPWMWLRWPSWGALYISGNRSVALRDASYCRDVLVSDWYRNWFNPQWKLRIDRNAITNYGNSAGGSRLAAGYFSGIVGERKDALFVDDANDPEQAQRDKRRLAINHRWDGTIGNRVNDLRHSMRCQIQQRVHAGDLSGHWLESNPKVVHICIPLEFEPQRPKDKPDYSKHEYPKTTPLGWCDPRTEAGEVLDPVRFPPDVREAEKRRLGSYGTAGQHQQRPAPPEGGVWKRYWWRYWVPEGVNLPPVLEPMADGSVFECPTITLPRSFDFMLQSWDMSFGNSKLGKSGKADTSSMVVGQVWKLSGLNRFLVDQVRRQMEFTETQKAFRQLSTKHPDVETKLIEAKANGQAIISSMRGEFSGILAIEPNGDKVSRAVAEEATLESGYVYLPHPGLQIARARDAKGIEYNWVEAYVDECAAFPNGLYNDVVDTSSQALMKFRDYIRMRDRQSDGSRTVKKKYFG